MKDNHNKVQLLKNLAAVWEEYPNFRFGQLILGIVPDRTTLLHLNDKDFLLCLQSFNKQLNVLRCDIPFLNSFKGNNITQNIPLKKHNYSMLMETIPTNMIKKGHMAPPSINKYSLYNQVFQNSQKNIYALLDVNPIVIDENYKIVDGYCSYLIAQENNIKNVVCIIQYHNEKLIKTVAARHLKTRFLTGTKNYYWRSNKVPVCPGMICYANTAYGKALVEISSIRMLPQKDATMFKKLSAKQF
ncbi:hypothetical protein [Butyrivibrio sp. WCE2006]|uniref:hypothetical protein n=1 Tax=Butyrivibrio sp. WCE2006 TaxID=1410611 RepID=UPI0005D2187E|nr:hypothetical protein [Butyrivibrio sp. WCE2006]